MLNTVDVYTSQPSADTLDLSVLPELDIVQIIDIQGLDPIKVSVNTTSLGSADGEDATGVTVPSRNIVLTLRGNPDWSNWDPYTLRKLIYSYFTPKSTVRLVFSRSGIGEVNKPTFSEMLQKHPEYFQKSWKPSHDFGTDIAWAPDVNHYVVCVLRPQGTGGNIFVAETDVGSLTGPDEPDWSSVPSIGDSISDGDITWYNAMPAASFSPLPSVWAPLTNPDILSFVWPTVANNHLYIRFPNFGSETGSSEPDWPIDGNYTVGSDGDIYWWDLGEGPTGDPPVEIFGIVESCDASSFTEDINYTVSIICPDPYFTAITATEINGTTGIETGTDVVNYPGNIPVGFFLTVTKDSNDAASVNIKVGDFVSYFNIITNVNDTKRFEMDSRSKKKMIRQVDTASGTAVSALGGLQDGSTWPLLQSGINSFSVVTDTGGQTYQLKYFAKYSGL